MLGFGELALESFELLFCQILYRKWLAGRRSRVKVAFGIKAAILLIAQEMRMSENWVRLAYLWWLRFRACCAEASSCYKYRAR